MLTSNFFFIFCFRLIKNSQSIEEISKRKILEHEYFNKIKSMDRNEFLRKPAQEKHLIAIKIEKGYQPFGILFKKGETLDVEYFYKIYELLSEKWVNESLDEAFDKLDQTEDNETNNDSSENSQVSGKKKIETAGESIGSLTINDVTIESQTSTKKSLDKLEYSDELYFDLLQKNIQVYHFNFVKFLCEETKFTSVRFQILLFITFFNSWERHYKHKINISKIIKEINALDEKQEISEESLKKLKAIVENVQQKVTKLKKIIDKEIKTNENILKAVLKNNDFKRNVVSRCFKDKKNFHSILTNLLDQDYEIMFNKICKNERLKSNFLFNLRRKCYDEEIYCFVFNDKDFKNLIFVELERPCLR